MLIGPLRPGPRLSLVKRTALKRTPFKRKASDPLRRVTLNPVSERTRQYNAEFKKASKLVKKRAGGMCEARFSRECRGLGDHVHHKMMRSHGGSNDPSNLVLVCHSCHEDIHGFPAKSYEAGWLVRGV